tara:strand:+ start:9335 stop:9544 length:210 start_codon:yes stop_codon:yes gene_type:complete
MSRSIREMKPGDFVKVNGQFEEITSIHGVSPEGKLAKPSEGGFSVETKSGRTVDMWQAQSYHKAEDMAG